MDVSGFRAAFPAFVSATTYPDAQVQYWLTLAGNLLPPDKWVDLLDLGTGLYVAHNLALEQLAAKSTAAGGIPGAPGLMTSKSVGPISVGYDASLSAERDAGAWSLTTYGARFIRLARLIGAGGTQL